VRTQDRLEYEWIFRSAYPRVLRTVSQILWSRSAAEDVAQEAFLKLLLHWRTASGYEQPEAWVRRVAIRLAIRQAQREIRRGELERTGQAAPKEQEAGDSELAKAIMTLAPMQRAAVVLYYYEDLPVVEVARILVVSESTVKQHLYRARIRLAALLEEEVHDDVDR
jgi:RNA polymerase sigma factor (sigma-70 family)